MAKNKENMKGKRRKSEGEIFYKAHPIVVPMGETIYNTSGVGYVIERVLWWALGFVELILLARLILAGFGADGGNAITSFIYTVSYPFVVFFFYLYDTLGTITVTGPTFEIETLSAMAVYYIFIYVIIQLIETMRGREM